MQKSTAGVLEACAAELEQLKEDEKSEREIIGWGTAQLPNSPSPAINCGFEHCAHLVLLAEASPTSRRYSLELSSLPQTDVSRVTWQNAKRLDILHEVMHVLRHVETASCKDKEYMLMQPAKTEIDRSESPSLTVLSLRQLAGHCKMSFRIPRCMQGPPVAPSLMTLNGLNLWRC